MTQTAHATKAFLGVGYAGLTDLRQTLGSRTLFNRAHDLQITRKWNEEVDPTSGMSVPEDVAQGDFDQRLKATLEGSTEGCIPALLRSLMGGAFTDSVVGTTGQQHLSTLADTLANNARLACEVRYGTDAESELFAAICKSLEFQITQAGYARWVTELIGSSPSYLASPTSPTLPSVASLLRKRVTTFSLDGATTHIVRGLSWKLDRKLEEDDYDVTSNQRRDASYGELMFTLDAELEFQVSAGGGDGMANVRRFWGGSAATGPTNPAALYALNVKTERTDVIPGGTAKQTVAVDVPSFFITSCDEAIKGRDAIRQRLKGRGIYNPGAGYMVQPKIINTVANY